LEERSLSRLFITILGILFFATIPVHAQSRSVAVQTGLFNFDLSGTGTSPAVAVSADWAATRHILLEGAMTFAFPNQQFSDRTTLLIPEALVQYQWRLGKFSPFVAGGIGAAIDKRDEIFGGTQTHLALSTGGGVRMNLTESMGLRGDFRLRGFGSHFSGSAAELRGGVFWRF
jgi:opacity protein-like surface antigen